MCISIGKVTINSSLLSLFPLQSYNIGFDELSLDKHQTETIGG